MNPNVLIFVTSSCPFCTSAKEYLSVKGVSFAEADVEKDARAARELSRINPKSTVPTMVINGRLVIGFDRGLIDNALARPPPPRRDVALQNLIFDPFER
ncbi:MAG: glutaredoxin domain-containing protein [Candidatus Micrarchaeota archaeon]